MENWNCNKKKSEAPAAIWKGYERNEFEMKINFIQHVLDNNWQW